MKNKDSEIEDELTEEDEQAEEEFEEQEKEQKEEKKKFVPKEKKEKSIFRYRRAVQPAFNGFIDENTKTTLEGEDLMVKMANDIEEIKKAVGI